MFAEIILLVGILLVAGVLGGVALADAFDLEPREKRRRQRRANRKARQPKKM